ncbi:MAG: hypothetical protein R3F11_20270 [Verrucomicrobiales bacterium]
MVVLTSDNGPGEPAMSQSLNFARPGRRRRGNKRDVRDGGTRAVRRPLTGASRAGDQGPT